MPDNASPGVQPGVREDEKEPLKEEKKITPIIDSGLRRETSITFDGKRSVSKTGFVGKDSAV
ncbi:Fasciclin-2 [Ooceraea biroi]|uniref:Fasciclin-2 n=1 Tax=Ooceraea biroi TaxID=2015173 RepID=A0A026VZH0_OOCBI|nr:Fasciclin-2 [Ooceraea biroi]